LFFQYRVSNFPVSIFQLLVSTVFFLFEEAAESVYRVGGILPLALRFGRAGR